MDLLLLAFGIIAAAAAAALAGAPSADLTDRPLDQLGSWTIVLALVVIALGNHAHLCALRRAVPWILLVLVTAIVGTNSRLAPANFTATMATVLAIALGVRLGTAAVRASFEVRSRTISVASTAGSIDRPRSTPRLRRLRSVTRGRSLRVHHDAGGSSSVARRAHNPKVAGSNPAPATIVRGLGPEGPGNPWSFVLSGPQLG